MKNFRGKKDKGQGMRPRSGQQLSLHLETGSSGIAEPWRNGMTLAYQGTSVVLCLETVFQTPQLLEGTLHLPLPPGAVARQIQDAVEAWLRQEAQRVIAETLRVAAQRLNCRVPKWSLSFSAQTDWVQHHPDGSFRFSWRLVEQPSEVIRQIVDMALKRFVETPVTVDLWSSTAS